MPDFALTPDGLTIETEEEIYNDLAGKYRAQFGNSLPVGDADPIGFVFGILSERIRLIEETVQDVYSSFDSDQATGVSLRVRALETGTFAQFAEKSMVTETLGGDDGTVVPDGSLVAVDSTGKRFQTVGDATLVLQPDWAFTTSYAVGDQVASNGKTYRCITAGVSGSLTSDAPGESGTPTADDITDGTVHWTWLGEGPACIDVPMTAVDDGAVIAVARDLKDIITVQGGWNSATNLKGANEGHLDDTDETLRLRRRAELQNPARSPADAIRAALMRLDGVANATVFMNLTDSVNSDGMPPHSVECLVQGGDDQVIIDTLWRNVSAGIVTTGSTSGTSIDSQGTPQTIKFTRPTLVLIDVDITLIKDASQYPLDGDARVKQAIADFGNSSQTGKDAVSSSLGAQAFKVDGVLDVTATLISIDPATPTLSITIPISLRQLATYATSRITVHSSDGVP